MTAESNVKNDIIYLSGCVIRQEKADAKRIASMDLKRLYVEAYRQSMTAIVGKALRDAGIRNDSFEQALAKAIRKNLLLKTELRKLKNQLEKEQIWHMPLKGSVMADYYPSPGLRQMADVDILIDDSKADKVRRIMVSMGFDTENYGVGVHDVFHKNPVYNFEIHRSLFMDSKEFKTIYDYYAKIKEKCLKKEGCEYRYYFTPEDFYIYMIAHDFKHFSGGGTGIRSLMDVYVYERRFGETLDRDYIRSEVSTFGIADFEKTFRSLSLKLYEGKSLSKEEQEMYDYIFSSGTYGNVQHSVDNDLKKMKGNKLKYVFRRVFPDMEKVRLYYPFFYRFPVFMPFLWIYRFFRGLTVKRRALSHEYKALKNVRSGKAKKHNN